MDAVRLAGALALLTLACGTGVISAPGGGQPSPRRTNHDPVVTVAPTASNSPVVEGQGTQLSVTADDPDGDSLGYAWTQIAPASPQGTFTSRTVRNPGWTAPPVSADTTFSLRVTISDGEGGSTSATLQLPVNHLAVNRAPVVSTITVTPAMPVAGQVVTLAITASDPDGDPLTITWTQTAPAQQGTFGSPGRATTTWTSPPLGVDSLGFSFQVTVTDGVNPIVQRQVTVPVKTPSYAADVQRIWTAQCTSCHDAAQPAGQLDLTASASWAALVSQPMVKSCGHPTRVVAGSASTSGLMDRLLGTSSCGTRMPENALPLSAGDLILVQSWILRGALNN
ncbi:MAG TPA: Ig-like domain-containing protein [Myxococcaceae bacterium]|nr:Ig-like domain-containing protein [Myxococcaceae bacterium]